VTGRRSISPVGVRFGTGRREVGQAFRKSYCAEEQTFATIDGGLRAIRENSDFEVDFRIFALPDGIGKAHSFSLGQRVLKQRMVNVGRMIRYAFLDVTEQYEAQRKKKLQKGLDENQKDPKIAFEPGHRHQ